MTDRSSRIARCAPLSGISERYSLSVAPTSSGFDDHFARVFFYFSGFMMNKVSTLR